ncbi:LysR family transcriptional regulator [Ancylobacter sp. A5.8]|uniref:LysR family transcriptional regulator n=1 Tax=Ancylobacter gelatini TaxID=2919920 RepID=UPI001F4D5905|nr:LysR family transcriptional regulator [Ancylobacter gelatini]MCJ8142276.1 LysR family transcriptional regulator [Ancylobacter gelatini]
MLHSRLMRYIDEVARAGSMRQAAERLGIASSAINRQILAFEEELGVAVFERLSNGVRLTAAGELLVEHIRATMKDHSRTISRISDLKTLRRTRINVATLEALTADVLAPVVSAWHMAYPLTHITLMAMPADSIALAVGGGEAQFGLGFDLPPQPNLKVYSSTRCSVGLVVGPDHPLASRSSVRASDLAGHPFALPAPGLTLRTIFDRLTRRSRLAIEPMVESNSIDLLKRLARLSGLATVLTRADVELERLGGTLTFVPIISEEISWQTLVILHRNTAQLSGLTMRFAEKLADVIQQIGDGGVSSRSFPDR